MWGKQSRYPLYSPNLILPSSAYSLSIVYRPFLRENEGREWLTPSRIPVDQSRPVVRRLSTVSFTNFCGACLEHRARVRSASKDESGNFTGVFLTLEPAGGGGDLVVTDCAEEIVEQLKARPDGRTWSLREVIEGVIPDLYIGCSNTPQKSRFRFITEAKMGQWERVYDFFRSLKSRRCPADDPVSDLDNNAKLTFGGHTQPGNDDAFWNRDLYAEVTLFERIVEEGVEENYVYEYDGQFKFVKKHVIKSGHTHLGIQTATFAHDRWWFGCYGDPKILLVTDANFQMKGRYEFDCSLGIEGLPNGRLLSATGRCDKDKGCMGSVQVAVPDMKAGLRLVKESR